MPTHFQRQQHNYPLQRERNVWNERPQFSVPCDLSYRVSLSLAVCRHVLHVCLLSHRGTQLTDTVSVGRRWLFVHAVTWLACSKGVGGWQVGVFFFFFFFFFGGGVVRLVLLGVEGWGCFLLFFFGGGVSPLVSFCFVSWDAEGVWCCGEEVREGGICLISLQIIFFSHIFFSPFHNVVPCHVWFLWLSGNLFFLFRGKLF